ncbi:MAG: cytochrome d ubiquinol oxidase subunit II [Chloroflexi bacterium]|nr:MAG: cytochrome d ubiquinol oxidase subunit II [Chloroflexota bacterium]
MDLNTLWFILITVLFIGYFILEGFDYGVGILLPFLGKTDRERRVIINTIGPFWDGNEVWLLTAGGAIFAAFPHWYATMFSGFYLALFIMLVALIVRGVAFEFRSKDRAPAWRSLWDWMIFVGSFVPALLWGVALGNLLRGVPIDQDMHYVGGFFNLLNPYALLGGLTTLFVFTVQGAIFLSLKVEGDLLPRITAATKKVGPVATVLVFAFVVAGYFLTDAFIRLGINPGLIPIAAGAALLTAGWFVHNDRPGWAFLMNCLTIVLSTITIFMSLYPRVIVSSLNPEWSLTIYNAASSPYTLRVMTIVALIFVPIVVAYQAWSYWVFRQRVSLHSELEY